MLENLCLLAFLLAGFFTVIHSEPIHRPMVGQNSFKLIYQHHRHESDARVATHEVEEIHSAKQRRSKLHYKPHRHKDSVALEYSYKFYSDDEHLLTIGSAICQLANRDLIDQTFNMNVLKRFEYSYVIGAARLLQFIEKNIGRFSLASPTHQMRPESGIWYLATFERGTNDEFTVFLSYQREPSKNLPYGIPQQIIITKEPKKVATYEFIRLQQLSDYFQPTDSSVPNLNHYSDYEMNSASYDLFFIDRAIGCSMLLGSDPKEVTKLAERDKKRFSFTANLIMPDVERPLETTVIYESLLSLLKLDQTGANGQTSSFINFKTNRKYHVISLHSAETDLSEFRSSDEQQSCISSRVKDKESFAKFTYSNPFTLGKMLFGTERLVYLGLARVRGIDARVFESHDCDWPVWLQQPAVIEQTKELLEEKSDDQYIDDIDLLFRDETKLLKEQHRSITSVFYFANTGDDIFDSRLLLVELFIKNDQTGSIVRKFTISIYDFTWDLISTGPNGSNYEDALSLQNDCLAKMHDNEYSTFEIRFEAQVNEQNLAWLQEPTKRNLAIMSMVSENLRLNPLSMIYDIKSRLSIIREILNPETGEQDHLVSLAVNLRAAMRSKSLVRIQYICRTKLDEKNWRTLRMLNFQACHMLAAESRKDSLMAFDLTSSTCYILRRELLSHSDPNKLVKSFCHFGDSSGTMEVYKLMHNEEVFVTGDERIDGLKAAKSSLEWNKIFEVFDPSAISHEACIQLRLKSANASPLNDEINHDVHQPSYSMFPGLGLVATDAQNKLVESKWFEDPDTKNYHQELMISMEHCLTACLTDIECRSYSACVSNDKMRCILSTVSFSTPSMVLQLVQVSETKAKFGQKFAINVGHEEQKGVSGNSEQSKLEAIQVVKHPTCEIHNKIYRDYFNDHGGSLAYNRIPNFTPVTDQEQCAELCFKTSVDFLTKTCKPEDSGDLRNAGNSRGDVSQPCLHYNYISTEKMQSMVDPSNSKKTLELMTGSNHQEIVGGFCILDSLSVPTEEESVPEVAHKTLHYVPLQVHQLEYSFLYAKRPDLSLAESNFTNQERVAVIKELKEAISRGETGDKLNENIGWLEETFNESNCARSCVRPQGLSQIPLPCRSFDYIEIDHPERKTRKLCAFNTVTLKSTVVAHRYDLIRRGADKQTRILMHPGETVRVWHFEPRFDIVACSLNENFHLSLDQQTAGIHIGGFSLFCVSALLVLVGSVAGLALGSRLLVEKTTRETDAQVEDRWQRPVETDFVSLKEAIADGYNVGVCGYGPHAASPVTSAMPALSFMLNESLASALSTMW